MARRRIVVLLCVVLLMAAASAVEAGRGRIPRPNIVIDLAEVTYVGAIPDTIILRGDRFRSKPGRVLLDGAELNILSWDNKTIEAELPVWVVPATYRVTVTKGAASIDNFSMDVAIGAIGPEGPEGPQGPPGMPAFYVRSHMVTTASAAASISTEAVCSAGDAVVGGGLSYSQAGQPQALAAQESRPRPAGDGWTGTIAVDNTGPGFEVGTVVEVFAVCADLTP